MLAHNTHVCHMKEDLQTDEAVVGLTSGVSLRRVQMFSQVNKMSAHNLAVVLVPTLFQTLNPDLMRLTREFIIHHMLLFLVNITPEPSLRQRSGVSLPPL